MKNAYQVDCGILRACAQGFLLAGIMPKISQVTSFHTIELLRVPEVQKISFQPEGNSPSIGKIFFAPRECAAISKVEKTS